MKNGKNIVLVATMALIMIAAAGCPKKQPYQANPATGDAGQDKKSVVEIGKPKTYMEQVEEITKKKERPAEGLTLYKTLLGKLPKGDPAREKLFDYIMAESLAMVKSKDRKKIQAGLDVALALNNIEAGNFYVQNRIIYAYTGFAQLERAAGNLDKAQAYTEKGLSYRFNSEAMRLRLEILMEKAKRDITAKKYAAAQTLLKEIIDIADIPENIGTYKEENTQAKALLDAIKGK